MTRRFARKTQVLSVAALLAAVLVALFSLAFPAQVKDTGPAPGESSALVAPRWGHQALPGTKAGQHVPASRMKGKKAGWATADSGNPLFFPVVDYGAGLEHASSVAVADLNGDGKPDLAAAGNDNNFVVTDGLVSVLLGNGDGTFQSEIAYDSGGTNAYSVTVADLNGDGKPDLVVTNGCASGTSGTGCSAEGVIGVLLGNGDGTFRPVTTYNSGGWGNDGFGSQAAVVDVNGDGKPDLVVSNCGPAGSGGCGSGAVGVLLGNGDGTFRPAVTYNSGGIAAFSVAVADVNGDHKPDIIVADFCASLTDGCLSGNPSEGQVDVLLGNGDGTFQSGVAYDSGGDGATSIVARDVNGDGKPDLLVGNCGFESCGGGGEAGSGVGVLLGNGDGTFQTVVTYASLSVVAVAVGDVNGDGKPDLVAADYGEGLDVLLGNGDGTFQAGQLYGTQSGGLYPASVAIGDVNGDGWPDLVEGNSCYSVCDSGGPVGVLLNVGDYIFTTTTLVSSLNPSVVGQSITFTAVVSSSKGTPTGIVIFSDGSTVLASVTLSNGAASFSTSSLPVGGHPITAAYQGSGDFLASSALLYQGVQEPPTTTSLTSSADPAAINQLVTYTASVTGQSGGLVTGMIYFYDSTKLIASVPLANNLAAYSVSYQSARDHAITAHYSGDANNAASVSPTFFERIAVLPVRSKTALTTSESPALIGQPVTFTATVSALFGIIPDGELVTFYDGLNEIGSGTTVSATATFTTSSLTAKSHTIKALYNGDGTFKKSTGRVTQVVDKYTTTTTIVSSLNPSSHGQAVTFTATVISTGPNAPTGKVRFAGIGSAPLSSGVATLTKSSLKAGTYAITAEYRGDSVSAASTSAVLDQVVNP